MSLPSWFRSLSAGTILVAFVVPALVGAGCASGDDAAKGGSGVAPGPEDEGGAGDGVDLANVCPDGVCASLVDDAACDGEKRVSIAGLSPLGGGLRASSAGPPGDLATSAADPDACSETVDWVVPPDPDAPPKEPPPSLKETFECPEGMTRLHVKDMWSHGADPTLGELASPPLAVVVVDSEWNEYAARQNSAGCGWYSVCLAPSVVESFQLKVVGADGCPVEAASGKFLVGAKTASSPEVWLSYEGDSASLKVDYTRYPNVAMQENRFHATADEAVVADQLCPAGAPERTVPTGFTKLHLRWLWGDPDDTGYPGTACGDDAIGLQVPPYPSSLRIEGEWCNGAQATLELQNGHCPWYSVLIPNEQFGGKITVRYPDKNKMLFSPAIELPAVREADEYWLAYTGAPDDTETFGAKCMNFSQRANVYNFFTENPGPGYAGCGGDGDVQVDPCNPPVPADHVPVHFRYLWAGQKIFSYFPNKALMPQWMVLEVNGGGGDKDVICYREEDRPWFNCPVPRSEFHEGATWRAVDKTHAPEWNTVMPRPFPSEPKEYWLRWSYGKPDIPETSRFKFYDYYPDGTNGDWSSTGDWNDDACAPKPPAQVPAVGFGGWFPYDETQYAYGFGGSLAKTFAKADDVQALLNAFVHERYEIWRDQYVVEGDLTCGPGTARVKTYPPETVSEGQGYGIAMAAAVGDKPTFEKLWRFTRHFLSQSSKKFCGGLMGWMWDGAAECRPIDQPCDPDTDGCGGNQDSAFDGDVDIGIGLVFAARQWPEYVDAAVNWLLKMECEVNTAYDGQWHYPTPGDTWDKKCDRYPDEPCYHAPGQDGTVNLSYYPPGYFRVFGDFLKAYLDPTRYSADDREGHRRFWYKTAATVYEMVERCYDDAAHPALVTDWGSYDNPCSSNGDNYNWARALWRISVDAAWFGHRTDLPENQPNSSQHYPPWSRMQAKVNHMQRYFAAFHQDNPVEPGANRFSSICQNLDPSGSTSGCDPAYGHNSYFVNTALTAYVNVWDDDGATTPAVRREALEEAVTTTVINDTYYQESIGVYTMLFLSGNFPNPMEVQ